MEKEAMQNKETSVAATVKEFIKLFAFSKTPRTIERQIKKGKWKGEKVRNKYTILIKDPTDAAKLKRLRELTEKPITKKTATKKQVTKKLTVILPMSYRLDEEFLEAISNLAEFSPEEIPGFVRRHKIKMPEKIYMRMREIAKKIHVRPGELMTSLLMVSRKNNQEEVTDDSINSN